MMAGDWPGMHYASLYKMIMKKGDFCPRLVGSLVKFHKNEVAFLPRRNHVN